MITTQDDRYILFYDSLGKLESANCNLTGATVWVRNSEFYTPESNALTADFLKAEYDLSDRPELASGV